MPAPSLYTRNPHRHALSGARAAAALVFAVAAVGAHAPGAAQVPGNPGFGVRSGALAGAGAGTGTSYEAAWLNPAGLAFNKRPETTLGFAMAHSGLSIDGHEAPLEGTAGALIGLSTPVPFRAWLEDRIHLGLAMFLPGSLAAVRLHYDEDPRFPLLQDTSRLYVLPALALKVHEGGDWLDECSLGASVNFLAGLTGLITVTEGPTKDLAPFVVQESQAVAAPIVGLRLGLLRRLKLGLAWRGEFSAPFASENLNRIGGGDVTIDLSSRAFFAPHQVVIGLGYLPGPAWTLSLDVTRSWWSRFDGGFVAINAQLPRLVNVKEAEINLYPERPNLAFKDIWDVRGGAQFTGGDPEAWSYAARAGAGYQPSPVPDQPGVTNLMDGGKTTLATGGAIMRRVDKGITLAFDVFVYATRLGHREYKKKDSLIPDENTTDEAPGKQVTNPGYPSIDSGGYVIGWGAALGARY